jgi:hypothetical protein
VTMHGCCAGTVSRQRQFTRRLIDAAGCVLPGVAFALLPKCPACLAAWLVAATGIGFSAQAAGSLRLLMAITSLVSILYLVARVRVRGRRDRA